MEELHFPPVARRSLSDQVADIIRAKIIGGDLLPGTGLREGELAEQLMVGRAAVREAVRQLIGEGLLVNHHHRGPSVWQPSPRDLTEMYELRAAMEGMCVRLILEQGRRDDLVTALAPIVEDMARADAARDFAETDACDARFHATIVEESGHERMRRVWQSAHPVVWTAAMPALRESKREPRLAELHRCFLADLAVATPTEAQEAMIVHVRNGEHLAIRNITAAAAGGREPGPAP